MDGVGIRDRRVCSRTLRLLGLCVALLAVPRAALAFPANCYWFGNGASNLWSERQNWDCGAFRGPEDGDTLFFLDGRNRPGSIDDIPSLQVAGIIITGRG